MILQFDDRITKDLSFLNDVSEEGKARGDGRFSRFSLTWLGMSQSC